MLIVEIHLRLLSTRTCCHLDFTHWSVDPDLFDPFEFTLGADRFSYGKIVRDIKQIFSIIHNTAATTRLCRDADENTLPATRTWCQGDT